jgi:membrane protease YdiL (CAAX protease family)
LSAPGRILFGFVLLWLCLDVTARQLGSFRGEAGFVGAAAVLVAALAVEWLFFDVRPVTALHALGLGRPTGGSIAIALGVSAVMLAFYPLYGLVSGSMPRLRADALALAPGIFAQAGIAEETVFRGFLFRHLRETRPFWPAALLSTLPFALVHIPIFFTQPLAVALASTLLALVIAFPLAFLFEAGGSTIWGAAIVHFVVQGSIKMVDVPPEDLARMAVGWMAVCATVPWLVFAWRKPPMVRSSASFALVLVLAGCAPRPADQEVTVTTPAPEATAPSPASPAAPAAADSAGFVNRVWRVTLSDAVAPGTLYVFLAESTLVIDGPGGTPMVGTWRREGDGLVMVEEGIAYETDILELRDDAFRILSHNPGKAVETTMVPAETSR